MQSNEKTIPASRFRKELRSKIRPEKAAFYPRFFKTGPGQYGEGDRFLGVTVPDIRTVGKVERDRIEISVIKELLQDEFHECRFLGLVLLIRKMEKADETMSEKLRNLYLSNLQYVNNWDLVDLSCGPILGPVCLQDQGLLFELSRSGNLWKERISVVTNLYLIRNDIMDPALKLCKSFLNHPHDLIHKACGWVLRELGKKDITRLRSFLNIYASEMPRTMLRYSIEKLGASERAIYMKK